MAKKKDKAKSRAEAEVDQKVTAVEQFGNVAVAFIGIITTTIKTLGWPGGIFVLGFWFFNAYGTIDQKREFIDMTLLGKDTGRLFWVILIAVLSGLVCLAQWQYYRRQIKVLQEEIDRLSNWKTGHQESGLGRDLHHTF
ncbi:hypothetical protein MUP77_13310 [Candidatus Bathyarchaeota archaeon]|nr:hypothetical protein [Candidatus Bathyarchaeota archaeon]